ncbi:MAG: GIY-YIG nuclease family protein [Calditrichales bacterium]|nr:GIY-YIG nuclease family protein [Calditrichales bacterium]
MNSKQNEIKLIDLIKVSGVALKDYKIHCARGVVTSPLEVFFNGKFKEWQERQNQKNFERSQVLSMIFHNSDKWLFAGLWDVHDVKKKKNRKLKKDYYQYSTTEVEGLEHLTGRVIIKFEKKFRASYLKGEKYGEQLVVSKVLNRRMSVKDFPGYNKVLLTKGLLKTVVREEISSWKSALSNVAGIYVISDKKKGKLYVGSAYGEGGIWQRLKTYIKNGHGGNKDLKIVIKTKGEKYTDNFQFSILEVCDLNSSKEDVIKRENHWKEVLLTRKFGYNRN